MCQILTMKHIFKREDIQLFNDRVVSSSSVFIVTHSNPDGDAIGSVIAMGRYLLNKGIENSIWTPNVFPDYLKFLDPLNKISIYDRNPLPKLPDLDASSVIICMDFNQLKRIDKLEKFVRDSKAFKILIDHHPEPESENFDLVFSEPDLSSTCECTYNLFKELSLYESSEKKFFDKQVAESLYVGLMTDTNNFVNSVKPRTFVTAASLIEMGVDKELLQHKVFGVFSEERMRLLGHVLLNKMVVLPDLEAAYIILTKEELEKFNFKDGDSEGFVNMPLNINNVNISALFTETSEHVRVSLRSVNDFSVNKLSRQYFNGAGHERAAGGRLYMPVENVGRFFEEKLREYIESNK